MVAGGDKRPHHHPNQSPVQIGARGSDWSIKTRSSAIGSQRASGGQGGEGGLISAALWVRDMEVISEESVWFSAGKTSSREGCGGHGWSG